MRSSVFPFWLLWCCCSWSLGAKWLRNDDAEKRGRNVPSVGSCPPFESVSDGSPSNECEADCADNGSAPDALACTTRTEGCVCHSSEDLVLNGGECIPIWMCDQIYDEAHDDGNAVHRGATS
ncbi:uncharacterized protein LOC135369998 isoform X2 [Ornithodoros turicata]|uniref:uncharacterized protein LOC135369998 isoform X2 n=1 Tax=Ornithodoros turicata TaxID=34597 RepID=UPI00313957FC